MCIYKKRGTDLNDVLVLSFYNTILLMSMRTRDMVINGNLIKKGVEILIFTDPFSLYGDDLVIKKPFD
jgi:hypothetical protein